MVFKRFEDMDVWKSGRHMVQSIYALTSHGEFAKDWGLRIQIQRAAVSICSNVAEGYARRGNRELLNFLWIAKGSAAEVQSQLYHAMDVGYVDQPTFDTMYDELNKLQAMLYRLIQALSMDVDRQKL